MIPVRLTLRIAGLVIFLLPCRLASAQEVKPLDRGEVTFTLDSIVRILRDNYVFPEVAEKMAEAVRLNHTKGQYDELSTPAAFAQQLTRDLQAVSRDKHLRVLYSPHVIAEERKVKTQADRDRLEQERARELKQDNFGFREAKILDGNIGYLDLRMFADPKYAGETAHAAMRTFSQVDALIIDLRRNGGGSPFMIQLISSYFFSDKPVHLNSFYDRPSNTTSETWTLPKTAGFRRPELALYILTSSYTFSAGEEFCYNLKNLKRATLIGEVTGGGAHPTGSVIATDKFFVRVPKGRAINPITQTNWEGTGVTPDIQVPADEALNVALEKARAVKKR